MEITKILDKVRVKNLKQLKLEITKYVEEHKIKKARFKLKTKDFTLDAKYEDGVVKVKNKAHTHWVGFDHAAKDSKPKVFDIYIGNR